MGGVMADAVAVWPVRRKVRRAGGRGGRFRALSRRMEGRWADGMVWMCRLNYEGIVNLKHVQKRSLVFCLHAFFLL